MPAQFGYLYELPDDIESGSESVVNSIKLLRAYLFPQDECAVCMTSLYEEPSIQNLQSAQTRLILAKLKPKKGQAMKTPCKHTFHATCLVEWMSIKMACPTCRSALPVLE